jgi:dihydrofolate synthase/folylpolyglutamate synthase
MRALLDRMGNPQRQFHAVHIAGTKGKGSTSAFTESMLRHLGQRTGLFTSPHLHSFRERIRVQGALMSKANLVDLVNRLHPHFAAVPEATIFDKITAIAFQHFADQGVTWAVIEVGLGGRLDSTNVLTPAVCGITRISKDHMNVLGNTLRAIAGEKAGIIKPGVPVYVAPQRPGIRDVFTQKAQAEAAALHWGDPLPAAIPLPLLGQHQRINAGLAWQMIEDLAQREMLSLDPAAMTAGLSQTRWPGRFEMLPGLGEVDPPLLVDCAHNSDSMNLLIRLLKTHLAPRPLTVIFGASRAKNTLGMMKRLLDLTPRMVLVNSQHPKALTTQELCAELEGWLATEPQRRANLTIRVAPTIEDALTLAGEMTPPGGVMVGAGSVFVAAALRTAWHERHPHLFPKDDWVHEAAQEPLITAKGVIIPERRGG